LKLTDSVSGNDSRLSSTIRAFLRLSQPWAEHDLRLVIEKKLKTSFFKKENDGTSFRKRKRVDEIP
jgi:hypothetical protein